MSTIGFSLNQLLFSADVDHARRFYEDILGLRLSDKSSQVIAFMHG